MPFDVRLRWREVFLLAYVTGEFTDNSGVVKAGEKYVSEDMPLVMRSVEKGVYYNTIPLSFRHPWDGEIKPMKAPFGPITIRNLKIINPTDKMHILMTSTSLANMIMCPGTTLSFEPHKLRFHIPSDKEDGIFEDCWRNGHCE